MKLSSNNEKIVYTGADLVNVLKEIDYILGSLHRMGSYFADDIGGNRTAYEKETTAFIDEAIVCDRLAAVRAKLAEGFDRSLGEDEMDDLERACQDIEYWSKPGDRSTQRWI